MSQPDLKSQVTSGILWSGAGRVVQQVIQFALSVVMARLLSPGDYGLMAMVMVFTGFAGMLADAGFNTALVQRQNLKEIHIHTVYWVTLGSGTLLAGITFLVSPWLASFYRAPLLEIIFRVVAVNFIFGALGNVPSALLQKAMRFKTLAKIEASSLLLSGIVGIGAAWSGAGVWSLVAQSVSAAMMTAIFRCWVCKWLPKPVFNSGALKDIWGFSGNLYGFNFINYWARNADNLMVGKFFGAAPLGAYNRAYALMLLPITQINSVISQVVFPAFAGIQNDQERIKRIYLRAIGIVALLVFPMMVGLALVADSFVRTVYGDKWLSIIPLLQIMSCLGATQALANSTGWLYFSTGRTKRLFYWGAFSAIVVILSILAGIACGSVVMVAIFYAAANILLFWPGIYLAGQIIGMRFGEVIYAVRGPFLATCGMAFCVTISKLLLSATMLPLLLLLIETLVGASVYLFLVIVFGSSAWNNVIELLLEGSKKSSERTSFLQP